MTVERKPLTFRALRWGNRRRIQQFKNAQGEFCHSEPDGSDWSIADWCVAAAGELGEAFNKIKKVRRGDFTIDQARHEIGCEIADVVVYLDILCQRLGIDLGTEVEYVWNKKSEKIGSTLRIQGDEVVDQ